MSIFFAPLLQFFFSYKRRFASTDLFLRLFIELLSYTNKTSEFRVYLRHFLRDCLKKIVQYKFSRPYELHLRN